MSKPKWEIIPDVQGNYDELNPIRFSYTYLHGKLHSDAGMDTYGLINCDLPLREDHDVLVNHSLVEDGLYPCVYKDEPCTLYFWHCSFGEPHGLITYDSDELASLDAKTKFEAKSITI
jgi:hypothetical protein